MEGKIIKAVEEGMYVLPPATVTYKDRGQTVYTSTSNTERHPSDEDVSPTYIVT